MVTRILPHTFRAKASSEGPCGNRALWERPNRVIDAPIPNNHELALVVISAVEAPQNRLLPHQKVSLH